MIRPCSRITGGNVEHIHVADSTRVREPSSDDERKERRWDLQRLLCKPRVGCKRSVQGRIEHAWLSSSVCARVVDVDGKHSVHSLLRCCFVVLVDAAKR